MAAEIAALAIGGVWWRQVPHDRDPLARPDPPRDARWQRGAAADALYLADSPDTAWAEWYRWLVEYGGPPRLIAPSAARAGGEVLCIFWPPHPSSLVRAIDGPETLREPPAPPV